MKPDSGSIRRCILAGIVFFALIDYCSNAQITQSVNTYTPPSGDPEELFPHPLGMFYTADDGVHGRELWLLPRLDAQPRLVRDITVGPESSNLTDFMQFKNKLVMHNDVDDSAALWITDGTKDGTRKLDLRGDNLTFSYGYPMSTWKNRFIFAIAEDSSNTTLWTLDGATLEPKPFVPFRNLGDRVVLTQKGFAVHQDYMILSAAHGNGNTGLWRSDGTTQGSVQLLKMYESPSKFLKAGDRTYFKGGTKEHGWELWNSDGTTEGTRMVKDIRAGLDSSSPGEFVHIPGSDPPSVYFAAETDEFGRELWRSDGTPEGTRMIHDIIPGSGSGDPYKLFSDNHHQIYFVANGEGQGNELWRTDTREDEAVLLKDIYPGPIGSDPYAFSVIREIFFFSALDPVHGEELYRSNGDPAGTTLLKDIYPGPKSSFPYFTTQFEGFIVFAAEHPIYGRELWRSGGSEVSTVLVRDLLQDGLQNPSSSPQEITATTNLLFFTADDLNHGMELWCTDGTENGTRLVRDIFPGRASSDPQELTAVGDLVYFRADNATHGVELWVSDGTERGTRLVQDISHEGSSAPRELTVYQDKIIFVAYNPQRGDELWIADQFSADSLGDVRVGSESSNPKDLTVWGDLVYFRADDGIHGEELWSTDGTVNGTIMVTDIVSVPVASALLQALVPFNGSLYFAHNDETNGNELYRISKTDPRPTLVKNIAP